VLLVALLIFVAAEIVAFVVVAEHIGILLAVVLLLGVSAAGPFLVRRSGSGVIEHARQRIQRGEAPEREVLDGVVLLLGGVLVCIPGFIGDVLGLLLLIGPVRHAGIRLAGHHLARRLGTSGLTFGAARFPGRPGRATRQDGPVVDAATHDRADGRPDWDPPALPADPDDPIDH
jgi:UPF0716 protein FxsA